MIGRLDVTGLAKPFTHVGRGVSWRSWVQRLMRLQWRVVGYLTLWLWLLYFVSARQVVAPLGAIGTPALLLALGAALLWVSGRLLPHSGLHREPHPLRPLLLAYFWYAVVSYGFALTRPLSETELLGAHRGLFTAAAMVGLALMTADGVDDRDEVATLLRRLVMCAAIIGVIGIWEFFQGTRPDILLPGLTWEQMPQFHLRQGLIRARSTALHPIEFSVLMGGILPLAIHFALYDRSRTHRRVAAVASVVLAAALFTSVSRSGFVSLALGGAVLGLGWGGRRLANALIAAAVALGAVWLLLPQLIDVLFGLFTETEEDHSIQARLDRVPRILSLIRARPWFGLGNGTWGIEDYFLVDNEIWVVTLETGVVGLALTSALIIAGIAAAICVRRLPCADEATGHLGRAVAASISALAVSMTTFDALHFRILTGTLFLLLGTAGALWRLSDRQPRTVGDFLEPTESVHPQTTSDHTWGHART